MTHEELKVRAVICDIDGTVAINDGHRGHFEWDKVGSDAYNTNVISVISLLMSAGVFVIFVSGREEVCREQTLEWLTNIWPGVESEHLLMRAKGDFRDDTIVKREIYEANIAGKYDIIGVFDDRNKVVKMWREIGLTCFQVAEGEF